MSRPSKYIGGQQRPAGASAPGATAPGDTGGGQTPPPPPPPPTPVITGYFNCFNQYVSSGSGRDWRSAETFFGGSVQRPTGGVYLPTNDLTTIGLVADEIQLFSEYNWVGTSSGPLSINIPNGFTPGLYTATFYFAELIWTSAGARVFEYLDINGVRSLQGYDPWAYAISQGGAGNDAVRFDIDFSIDSSGSVSILEQTTAGNPFIVAFAILPRTGTQPTYIIRNVGVNAADQVFDHIDSNGITWTADRDWEPADQAGDWNVSASPLTNLPEYGFNSSDTPLFYSYRFSWASSGSLSFLDYNISIQGGHRYQVGFITSEQFVAQRPVEVLWNGVQVIPPITPTPQYEIALAFGWLDLRAVSGPQTGVLRFQCQDLGGDNLPLICGFYVLEETVQPPGQPKALLYNLGGDVTRDFVTVAGETWQADPPYLDPTMVETERYTIPGVISGLTQLGFQQADQGLIQDVRFSSSGSLKYTFSLETGTQWILTLYLVEDSASGNSIGGRVFDVLVDGTLVGANVDPFVRTAQQYDYVVEYQCSPFDLTQVPGPFADVDVEFLQTVGALGPIPYPMVPALRFDKLVLSKVREIVQDDQGNARTNESDLHIFVWDIFQIEPLVLTNVIVQTDVGTTDAQGYFEIDMPPGILPGTPVAVGVSNAMSAEDATQWGCFVVVLTRQQ